MRGEERQFEGGSRLRIEDEDQGGGEAVQTNDRRTCSQGRGAKAPYCTFLQKRGQTN